MMKSKIRLIIADDQHLFAECLKIALKNESDTVDIVGIAKNGFEVLEILEKINADLILMDIRMPEMDGLETLRRISSKYPEIKVLMLTTFTDKNFMQEALANGAKGYLLKDSNPNKLVDAIQMVLHDMLVFTESAFDMSISVGNPEIIFGSANEVPEWYPELSKREKEFLYYIKTGLSNTEISLKLNLAEQTVKNYITIIYDKIGIQSRKELRKLLK